MPASLESRHAQLHRSMKENQAELFELHRALVQIPSVNWGDGSSARETEVARCLVGYLTPAGVSSRIVEGAPERGNLLAHWAPKGRLTGRLGNRLLMMSHSDVVPAGDEDKWRHPPFSAARSEGRIWGRGANDCKMLVACEAFALASIARSEALEAGELRLAVGADEEAGGRWGFGWLAEREAEFLKADLAVNEGGGAYLARGAEGREIYVIGTGEKGRYEVIFTAEGPGTHASVPWGRMNPAVRIAELATSLAAWSSPPTAGAPILDAFRNEMGFGGSGAGENFGPLLEAARKISKSFYNSLMAQTRLTLVPTILRSGEKSNAVPTSAELRCDARLLPGQAFHVLERAVVEVLRGFPDIAFRIEQTAAASGSQLPDAQRIRFERAIGRATASSGGTSPPTARAEPRVLPSWCTGFTDSRFVRPMGTPTYGFQLVIPEADPDRLGIHCIDESIDEAMLLPCALSLAHLALDFCEEG